MNKKQMIIFAIIAIVMIVAIIGVVALTGKKQELSLQELNEAISQKEPFNEMPTQEIDLNTLSSLYMIDETEVEEVVGKMPMMNIQASMYLIIKAKDGSVDSVKAKVEEYGQKQEQVWSTYLPEQYDLVKARRQGVVGNYVYLVIAQSAADIEEMIIH